MLGLPGIADRLKTALLYLLPQHWISRAVYWLTRQQSSLATPAIRQFTKVFDVAMADAVQPDLATYPTFNAFFTRALKAEARPIASEPNAIASPADGRISAIGPIVEGQLFQAKRHNYSLLTLLGGDQQAARRLANGSFTTIYLSPRDYHRLHMPVSGRLISQTHVPGRLHSVSPFTVRALPNLFTRNERVIASFETEHGLMSLVLVGAINVAAIETVWHGLVTPPQRSAINHIDYTNYTPVKLSRGEEMGRFNMGSTIIVLLEKPVTWRIDMQANDAVLMGQFLGNISAD